MAFIYKITNDINDKIYIGKTVDSIEKRWKEHCQDSKKRELEKRPLYNAINKYGIEHFYIEIVEECSVEELSKKEIYWIGYYHSYSNGYNATYGGDGKILYDYNYIVEEYNKGKLCKEIVKELNCDSSVITSALRNANINPKKNKINKLSKKIGSFDLEGELIQIFDSETEAAKWLIQNKIAKTNNIRGVITTIGRVASGQRKTAYKMIWKFI